MIWLLIAITLASGMLLPVQAGVNAQLRTHVGYAMTAAIINFLLGATALFAVSIVMRTPLASFSKLSSVPWWLWLGGLYGANYIVVSILLGAEARCGDAHRRECYRADADFTCAGSLRPDWISNSLCERRTHGRRRIASGRPGAYSTVLITKNPRFACMT